MRMSTCPGTMVYMPPEAQKSDYKETSDNFDKLDVFSFGVLILHVYTQQWPQPTDLFDEHNMPRTEVQRRQHLLDQMEDDTMKQLSMECLINQPQSRPHTLDLVRTIEGILKVLTKLYIILYGIVSKVNEDNGIIPKIIESIRYYC